MLIDITGSRCISCRHYTQHYRKDLRDGDMLPTNYGFCGYRQCCTNPGRRCKHYMERSNTSGVYRIQTRKAPPAEAGRA